MVDFAAASLAITLYMIPFVTIQIFTATITRLSDVGRTLLAGFGIYTLGGISPPFSITFSFFLAGRAIQGIGGLSQGDHHGGDRRSDPARTSGKGDGRGWGLTILTA